MGWSRTHAATIASSWSRSNGLGSQASSGSVAATAARSARGEGHEGDSRGRLQRAQVPAERGAVEAGHEQVEQDDIRLHLVRDALGLPVGRGEHAVARVRQGRREDGTHGGVVVDREHRRGGEALSKGEALSEGEALSF